MPTASNGISRRSTTRLPEVPCRKGNARAPESYGHDDRYSRRPRAWLRPGHHAHRSHLRGRLRRGSGRRRATLGNGPWAIREWRRILRFRAGGRGHGTPGGMGELRRAPRLAGPRRGAPRSVAFPLALPAGPPNRRRPVVRRRGHTPAHARAVHPPARLDRTEPDRRDDPLRAGRGRRPDTVGHPRNLPRGDALFLQLRGRRGGRERDRRAGEQLLADGGQPPPAVPAGRTLRRARPRCLAGR